MEKMRAVVLAAGKGTRLNSESEHMPKVMRLAAGRPLIDYVLKALPVDAAEDVAIVVGYMKEKIVDAYPGYVFAEQREQKGTGHAVMSAKDFIGSAEGPVLISAGDMPVVTAETYKALTEEHRASGNDCTILVGSLPDGGSYGRIVRDDGGNFLRITEAKDCTAAEREICEVNSGIYVFDSGKLLAALPELNTQNAQGEYYLTDVPDIMMSHGWKVGLCVRDMGDEICGVNTPDDLRRVEEILASR